MTTTAPAPSSALPDFSAARFPSTATMVGVLPLTLFPPHLLGLPFMPFNKGDKLNKVSDWSFQRNDHRGGGQGGPGGAAGGPGTVRVLVEEEEIGVEDEGGAFSLVDTKVKPKPRYGYRPFQQQQRRPQQQQGGGGGQGQRTQTARRQEECQHAAGPAATTAAPAAAAGLTQRPASPLPQSAPPHGISSPTRAATHGRSSRRVYGARSRRVLERGSRPQLSASHSPPTSAANYNQRGGNQPNQRRFYNDQKDQKPPSIAVDEENWKLTAEIECCRS